ncbi:hypothetical protein MG293_000236 [Ovis ammon polii]|uniref:Uncharacterized protein n=1 Tax=Ovis ammon polii TaxID=230172 RepID=A0AAD4UMJ3_OVIAM|nr:hypothetical protein MG293_000236 [Ovis ammon polii]
MAGHYRVLSKVPCAIQVEEIPFVQGKEQQLRFAGAAEKRYPTPKASRLNSFPFGFRSPKMRRPAQGVTGG